MTTKNETRALAHAVDGNPSDESALTICGRLANAPRTLAFGLAKWNPETVAALIRTGTLGSVSIGLCPLCWTEAPHA